MRILFAEDDVSIRSSVSKMLRSRTYAVDEVGNGQDALDYLLETPYDLAVFDIMMPKMDGLTAVKKAREKGNKTPVIFLTASIAQTAPEMTAETDWDFRLRRRLPTRTARSSRAKARKMPMCGSRSF